MHSFEEHSNMSACRKSGRFGMDQVNRGIYSQTQVTHKNSLKCFGEPYLQIQCF